MSAINKNLKKGQIYISRGGTLTLLSNKGSIVVPWGYDRVQFLGIENDQIIVKTPWNSTCILSIDYPLEITTEIKVRSEFPLRGLYIHCDVISFSVAVKKGICKELTKKELDQIEKDKKIKVSTVTKTSKGNITSDVITYLSTPHTISEVASHFGVKYQKIRYIIKQLITKGHEFKKFKITKVKINNKDTIQIIGV